MRKFLFLLTLTMTCQSVEKGNSYIRGVLSMIYRCENEEVVCYLAEKSNGSSIFCNFKSDNVKKSQNEDRKDDK